MKRCVTALVLATASGVAQAQTDLHVLDTGPASPPPGKMLYRFLLKEAEKHFDARRQAVAAIKTPADLKRRQEVLKAHWVDDMVRDHPARR